MRSPSSLHATNTTQFTQKQSTIDLYMLQTLLNLLKNTQEFNIRTLYQSKKWADAKGPGLKSSGLHMLPVSTVFHTIVT